ncbi:MAG: hypothetical protein ACTSXC_00930 [Candidatus Freyarchaeota archaeon]
MRVRIAYRYHGLPIEVEVEGEIRPEGLPAILEYLLDRLSRWVEKIGNGDRK